MLRVLGERGGILVEVDVGVDDRDLREPCPAIGAGGVGLRTGAHADPRGVRAARLREVPATAATYQTV